MNGLFRRPHILWRLMGHMIHRLLQRRIKISRALAPSLQATADYYLFEKVEMMQLQHYLLLRSPALDLFIPFLSWSSSSSLLPQLQLMHQLPDLCCSQNKSKSLGKSPPTDPSCLPLFLSYVTCCIQAPKICPYPLLIPGFLSCFIWTALQEELTPRSEIN